MKFFIKFLFLVIITININQEKVINWTKYSSFAGYQDGVRMKYSGMPNEKTFSIISDVYNYNAVNLYYPKDINVFTYKGTRIKIIEVKPLYLKIDVLNPWYKK